jgi:hypothetical protein
MESGATYRDHRRATGPVADGQAARQPYLERLSVHLLHTELGRWGLDGDPGAAGSAESGEWAVWVVREPEVPVASPEGAADAVFAGAGAEIELWAAARPDSREIELVWRKAAGERDGERGRVPLAWAERGSARMADSDPGPDMSAFIHFLDASGRMVGQADGPPSSAAYFPSWAWRTGDVVASAPVQVPAGAARALVGLYDPETGARVRARDASGGLIEFVEVPTMGAGE